MCHRCIVFDHPIVCSEDSLNGSSTSCKVIRSVESKRFDGHPLDLDIVHSALDFYLALEKSQIIVLDPGTGMSYFLKPYKEVDGQGAAYS